MSQLAISEFWEVTPVLSNSSSNCLILANGSRFSSGINSLSKSVIPPLPAVIRFASFPPSKKINVTSSVRMLYFVPVHVHHKRSDNKKDRSIQFFHKLRIIKNIKHVLIGFPFGLLNITDIARLCLIF